MGWIEKLLLNKKKRYIFVAILITASLLLACGSAWLIFRSAEVGVEAAQMAFARTKEEAEMETYQSFYKKGYDRAEQSNHVSNEATIFIEKIQEVAKLEVLKVKDVEFIVEDAGDNDKNITSWLEVAGEGVFTVDLAVGEFLVDNLRRCVVVRVPEPRLTECVIDYDSVRLLKWDNDWWNDSIADGENLARKNMDEAFALIKKELTSNQRYFQAAKTSAENLIVNFIKELNSDIPELEVVVEFME